MTYEADSRHVETVLKELGLQSADSVSTPGVIEHEIHGDDELLDEKNAKQMRIIIAVLKDVCFAVKETARTMASPTIGTERAVYRLAKYLRCAPRLQMMYRRMTQKPLLHIPTRTGQVVEELVKARPGVFQCSIPILSNRGQRLKPESHYPLLKQT